MFFERVADVVQISRQCCECLRGHTEFLMRVVVINRGHAPVSFFNDVTPPVRQTARRTTVPAGGHPRDSTPSSGPGSKILRVTETPVPASHKSIQARTAASIGEEARWQGSRTRARRSLPSGPAVPVHGSRHEADGRSSNILGMMRAENDNSK